MKLHIAEDRLIEEVQHEFNSMYPFLKIEFFNKDNGHTPDTSASRRIPSQKKLSEASKDRVWKGEIQVSDEMTVHELEETFNDQFGLLAQVFRKSGNLWLETTVTDGWTLKQQNDHGTEIARSYESRYQAPGTNEDDVY